MRQICVRLALALLAASPVLSTAQTGSGTVQFAFTDFSGPIARSSMADAANPANWGSTGLVNGVTPAPTGAWASDGSTGPWASGFVMGQSTLSGASVNFRYNWVDASSAGANVVSFTPAAFSNVAIGQSFVLGTLTYQNGFWYGGGETAAFNTPTNFGFTIHTVSPDGPAFNQTLSGTLRNAIHSVPNDGGLLPANYQAEADWVYMTGANVSLTMGALRVYDDCCKPGGATNSGSVQILARFNSLDIDAFGQVSGGGFVTTSVAPLPAVPEPETWAMLLAGLGVTGALARRRITRTGDGADHR